MFKIKLLILLLTSALFFACTHSPKKFIQQFNIEYIEGGESALYLSNSLKRNLESYGYFNENSNLSINAKISHGTSFYVTKTDNTSSRERVSTSLNLKVNDKMKKCTVYEFNKDIIQFYLVSESTVYLSNDAAVSKIKKDNTDALVANFIFDLIKNELKCKDKI